MSASVVYIVVLPLISLLIKKLGGIVTLALIFILPRMGNGYPGLIHFMSFMPAFCLGTIFSEYEVFEWWDETWKKKTKNKVGKLAKLVCMIVMLLVAYKSYYYMPTKYFWDIKWGIIPIAVILFINDYLVNVPIINKVLSILGKHSANIWWVHTFFRLYYCQDFIYGMKNAILVFSTLLIISLLSSLIIEKIKRQIGYDLKIKKIFNV